MEKLSLLTFSRNDVDKALDLIRSVYEIVDEIVLIDSSDKSKRRKLLGKEVRGLKKLKIFHTVALGLVEPLRMYGVSKCYGDWILYLDTDERLNGGLKESIRQILSRSDCDAYAVKRYEEVSHGKATDFFTWNIRLYKRGSVVYKGLLHEQPQIRGRLERLDKDDCFIEHVTELKTPASGLEYVQIEKFERMSYKDLNNRMADYVSKILIPENPADNSLLGKFFLSLLIAYERLGMKKQEQEISDFDYWMYDILKESTYLIKRGKLSKLPDLLASEEKTIAERKRWKAESGSDTVFAISKIVNKIGLIRFLHLDKEGTIKALNKKYEGKKQGIGLLMRLLREQYEKEYKTKSHKHS